MIRRIVTAGAVVALVLGGSMRPAGAEESIDDGPWAGSTLNPSPTSTAGQCGQALCGSCTIHIDGQAARSCITAVSDVEGRQVTTIEGLHPSGDHPVQKAWRELNVPQCGFCQTGQIMQAAALLAEIPNPDDRQIRDTMAGNICRCGCYQRIEAAVRLAATGT